MVVEELLWPVTASVIAFGCFLRHRGFRRNQRRRATSSSANGLHPVYPPRGRLPTIRLNVLSKYNQPAGGLLFPIRLMAAATTSERANPHPINGCWTPRPPRNHYKQRRGRHLPFAARPQNELPRRRCGSTVIRHRPSPLKHIVPLHFAAGLSGPAAALCLVLVCLPVTAYGRAAVNKCVFCLRLCYCCPEFEKVRHVIHMSSFRIPYSFCCPGEASENRMAQDERTISLGLVFSRRGCPFWGRVRHPRNRKRSSRIALYGLLAFCPPFWGNGVPPFSQLQPGYPVSQFGRSVYIAQLYYLFM